MYVYVYIYIHTCVFLDTMYVCNKHAQLDITIKHVFHLHPIWAIHVLGKTSTS